MFVPTPAEELALLFQNLVAFDEQEVARMAGLVNIHVLNKGDTLFKAEDQDYHLYFLASGRLYCYYDAVNGGQRVNHIVRRGDPLGSITTVIHDGCCQFNTTALRRSRLLSIDYRKAVALSQHSAVWGNFLRRLFENVALCKQKREKSFLMLSAKERYQEFIKDFADDMADVPLKIIANYLGITDVALSRIRKEMGLTQVKKKLAEAS